MHCPYCGYTESKVISTRHSDDGETVRRRRECLKCEGRFTTYERVEMLPIMVVKKDGTRESFDHCKLVRGITRACEKRSITQQQIEDMASGIERSIKNSFASEISSVDIGKKVMDALKGIDEVAYIRFAAVYRHYTDVADFIEELNKFTLSKNSSGKSKKSVKKTVKKEGEQG